MVEDTTILLSKFWLALKFTSWNQKFTKQKGNLFLCFFSNQNRHSCGKKHTCIVIKITFIKENNKKIIKQKISQKKRDEIKRKKERRKKKKANHEKVSSWGGTSSWRKDWCLLTRTIGNILQPKTGVFEESFTRSLNLSLPVSDSWGPIEPKRAAWHYQGNGIWWRKENGYWGFGVWGNGWVFVWTLKAGSEKKWGFWVCWVFGGVLSEPQRFYRVRLLALFIHK